MRTVDILVEPLTPQAFAPFGQVIEEQDGQPVFYGAGLRSWQFAYDIDGRTELMVVRYDYQPMTFSSIERHFNVTQCFIPLGNAAMVMVVAPRTDEADWSAQPAPESLRAFLVSGRQGILLWRATWHALNRFPIAPPGGAFALLTAMETQAELERQLHEGAAPKLTQQVDYAAQHGTAFRVVDRAGLLPPS